jgi:hypothetical protein
MKRRSFLLLLSSFAVSPAFADDWPTDPREIVVRLYRMMAGKDGAYDGEAFGDKAVRSRYFSTSFRKLVERAEKRAAGEVWLDMDPIMNSQDPQKPKKLDIAVETAAGDKTIVVAKFDQFDARIEVRYDFVRENGVWKIEDIRGQSNGKDHYSVRKTAAAT